MPPPVGFCVVIPRSHKAQLLPIYYNGNIKGKHIFTMPDKEEIELYRRPRRHDNEALGTILAILMVVALWTFVAENTGTTDAQIEAAGTVLFETLKTEHGS